MVVNLLILKTSLLWWVSHSNQFCWVPCLPVQRTINQQLGIKRYQTISKVTLKMNTRGLFPNLGLLSLASFDARNTIKRYKALLPTWVRSQLRPHSQLGLSKRGLCHQFWSSEHFAQYSIPYGVLSLGSNIIQWFGRSPTCSIRISLQPTWNLTKWPQHEYGSCKKIVKNTPHKNSRWHTSYASPRWSLRITTVNFMHHHGELYASPQCNLRIFTVNFKPASDRPCINKKQSATDFSGSHCAWAKTIGNFLVGDYLRPERNCDDFKTIWHNRRS